MNQILDQLNPIQKQAVLHQQGPLLILAGAGSGKTKTLTHRIAYLVSNGISPSQILAVTFTNKAANEMKERVNKLISSLQLSRTDYRLPTTDNRLPFLGTFHSVCVKILHREIQHLGYSKNFNIYDSDDQLSAVKQAMRKLNFNTNEINPRAIHAIISNAKNDFLKPNDLKNRSNEFIEEVAGETYQVYQEFLKENNALDFDDLIMLTIEIFQKFPNVLAKYQQQFKYVLVDEYQDTNKAQYLLINLLSKKHQNITVVGDDWQSIYSWRGADISNILNFEKDFKKTKVLKLEQNYRSTQNILDVADSIISKNKNKKDKKLWTNNSKGEKPVLFEAEDEQDEAKFIINEINSQNSNIPISQYPNISISQNSNIQYNNFVILYRTNAQSRSLEESFLKNNIPYKIIGGFKFYERKEIKDIIAYLRVINSPKDTVGLGRIINTPARKIGAKTLGNLEKYAKQKKVDYIKAALKAQEIPKLSLRIKNNLEHFGLIMDYLIKKTAKINLTSLIDLLLTKTGYKDFILDGSKEGEYRWENIQELKSVANKYNKNKDGLTKFLEEVALISETDDLENKKNFVALMTMHAAKGLEFKTVFIVGLEENLFPHSRSLNSQEELEEERRLCYVAMTRAKEKLYLSFAKCREIYGQKQSNPVSRFISDIPKNLLQSYSPSFNKKTIYQDKIENCKFKTGDKVRHHQFGKGLVIGFNNNLISVIFEKKIGLKKLSLDYAKIEKAE